VRLEKPLAYRTLEGDWLCPPCWQRGGTPGSVYYPLDLHRINHPACRGCGERVRPAPESLPDPCAFCGIIAGAEPVEWVVRPDFWPDTVAFLPLEPVTEGHCLIAPKVHVRDFADEPEVFAVTARRAAELMRWSARPMNVITTKGRDAGQEVMHLHLHLIPREKGDGLRLLNRRKT